MSLLDDAWRAVRTRMEGDATLTAMLPNGEVDIVRGWPSRRLDEPKEEHFPIVAATVPNESKVHTGRGDVRVDLHVMAWRSGPNGGDAKVAEIDGRLEVLFDEATWTQGGDRFYGFPTDAMNDEGAGDVLHRIRQLRIGVN